MYCAGWLACSHRLAGRPCLRRAMWRDGDVWAVHARVAAQSWAQGGPIAGQTSPSDRWDDECESCDLGGPGSREPVHCGRSSPWLSVTRVCLAMCALRGLVMIVTLTSELCRRGVCARPVRSSCVFRFITFIHSFHSSRLLRRSRREERLLATQRDDEPTQERVCNLFQ